MLAAGVDVDAAANNDEYIRIICQKCHLLVAEYLRDNVKSPNTIRHLVSALYPLSWDPFIAKWLVENKVDVSQPQSLRYVCGHGCSKSLEVLLDAGARISHGNERALQWVADHDSLYGIDDEDNVELSIMTTMLLDAGASTRCPEGTWSVLHVTPEYDLSPSTIAHDAVLTMIELDPGLLESRNTDGMTPLMSAAYYMRPYAAKFLLEAGADVAATDSTGKTPLMFMTTHSPNLTNSDEYDVILMTKLVRALVDAGADPTRTDHSQQTVLHIATSAKTTADRCGSLYIYVLCEAVLNRPADAQWAAQRWVGLSEAREERQAKRRRYSRY
jgi:hypothetical protein